MQASGTGSQSGSSKYAPSVSNAIISAYYPRVTAAADAARSRAQGAFAIVSAIAAGLVGAGALVNLETARLAERALGAAALFTWLAAAVLYIRAVAAPVPSVAATQPASDAFVDAVLDSARAERRAIDHRQALATGASIAAIVLTTATVLGLLLVQRPQVPATLTLSTAGTEALGRLCAKRPTVIRGMLDPASLDARFVVIEVEAGACQEGTVELLIASDQVLGAERAG